MKLHHWLRSVRMALFAVSLLGVGCFVRVQAAESAVGVIQPFDFDHPVFAHQLPFAKREVVIQVTAGRPAAWNMALNIGQNLLDFFGQDKIRIVVVAFGPGLKMLLVNSPVRTRLESENNEGIEFDACHQTMKAMARKLGHMPLLVSQATVVPAGVARIMQLEHAGFQYVRP